MIADGGACYQVRSLLGLLLLVHVKSHGDRAGTVSVSLDVRGVLHVGAGSVRVTVLGEAGLKELEEPVIFRVHAALTALVEDVVDRVVLLHDRIVAGVAARLRDGFGLGCGLSGVQVALCVEVKLDLGVGKDRHCHSFEEHYLKL